MYRKIQISTLDSFISKINKRLFLIFTNLDFFFTIVSIENENRKWGIVEWYSQVIFRNYYFSYLLAFISFYSFSRIYYFILLYRTYLYLILFLNWVEITFVLFKFGKILNKYMVLKYGKNSVYLKRTVDLINIWLLVWIKLKQHFEHKKLLWGFENKCSVFFCVFFF
jgi:hypothetical protein